MTISKKLVMRMDHISAKTHEAPICLRITLNRQTTYKTIYRLKPEYWNQNRQLVTRKHPNYAELNTFIEKEVADIEKWLLMLNSSTGINDIGSMRRKIHSVNSCDFLEHAKGTLDTLLSNGQYCSYKNYHAAISKLIKYLNRSHLPINKITSDFIENYALYLKNTLHNKKNTITENMKILEKLLLETYNSQGLKAADNPFIKTSFTREQAERCYLEESELDQLISLKLTPGTIPFDVRNIFLTECYTGLRISDILRLKWSNYDGAHISIVMKKTGSKITVPIIRKVQNIFDGYVQQPSDCEKYIFNFLKVDIDSASKIDISKAIISATVLINNHLKKLAKKAGISKNISTHTARHRILSFAL